MYKRARDEQVTPRYRAGEPTPGMSRERFCGCSTRRNIWLHISMRPRSRSSLASKAARRAARPVPPYIRRCRTCCWRRGAGPRRNSHDALLAVREGIRGRSRLAARCPLLCLTADRVPDGRFGPVRRIALTDVVYEDRWGQPYRLPAHLPASVKSCSIRKAFWSPPSYSRHFEANAAGQALAHRKCDLNATVVK